MAPQPLPEPLRLQAEVTVRLPLHHCDGCDGCGLRCLEGWELTQAEFAAILDYLETLPPEEVRRVVGQKKTFAWGEGEVPARFCLFRDVERNNCFIYPVRPLICRLFGFVEWLPCPLDKVPLVLPDGWEIMRRYAQFERQPWRDWMAVSPRARRLVGWASA
ncbi:MAG TPA: YkgJ family cysteine cluster protein [Armatimonadetes bacterium]|nr:YkgJ family cysteine cluster protein [Armatimonadota bacterium]